MVTPNDGVEDGNAIFPNSLTVSNTAPVIDSVTLSPDPATTSDDLTCEVSASDDDGDDLVYTYVWSNTIDIQQTTTEVCKQWTYLMLLG